MLRFLFLKSIALTSKAGFKPCVDIHSRLQCSTTISPINMKINSLLVFVYFLCYCQAYVAIRRPNSLGAVRRQPDDSQQGGGSQEPNNGNQAGGTTSQNPTAEQEQPSQQDTQQKQPAANSQPDTPTQQETTPNTGQQPQPAAKPEQNVPEPQNTPKSTPQQGTTQQNPDQQAQRPQSQNEQAAGQPSNTQQDTTNPGLKSSNQDQGSQPNNASPENTPVAKPSPAQQIKQQNAGDSQGQNQDSQGQQTRPEQNQQTHNVAAQGKQTQVQQTHGQEINTMMDQGRASRAGVIQGQQTQNQNAQGQQTEVNKNQGGTSQIGAIRGQQTQIETGDQQTRATAQRLPTQTQEASNSPDITGGTRQSPKDQSQGVDSEFGTKPTNTQLSALENLQSSGQVHASRTGAESSAGNLQGERSRTAFSPLVTPTESVGGDVRGNDFQQQQTSFSANNGQQSASGLGQIDNTAASGIQPTPSKSGSIASPTSSTVPHWGQCGGTYNGGASGQCAEGSQCICKDSSEFLFPI